MMAYLAPLGAAVLGLVVGFGGGSIFVKANTPTLDRVEDSASAIAGLLVATNTLLGGILGVLLFLAMR
jgi:hypothetical protein